MTPDLLRQIDPKFFAPVVAVLVHPSNRVETGGIFEAGGGYVRKLRWERSSGVALTPQTKPDPEHLVRSWDAINSFAPPVEHPTVPVLSGDQTETASLVSVPEHVPVVNNNAVDLGGQVAVISGAATR